MQRLEHRLREGPDIRGPGIVEGFERYLATRGLVPAPDPLGPLAIVFVDLSGFTRLTRERGDESAVVAVSSLQRHADATARLYGGRLVKLLGDGAMLRLGDATAGVDAALDRVDVVSDEGALWLHTGIKSRIADVAGPGEVLASEAVVEAAQTTGSGSSEPRMPDWRDLRALSLFTASRGRLGHCVMTSTPQSEMAPSAVDPLAVHDTPLPSRSELLALAEPQSFPGAGDLQRRWPFSHRMLPPGCHPLVGAPAS